MPMPPHIPTPSPNHDARRAPVVDILLLHYTGMATAAAALARLCDPAAKVSAHYLIAPDGATHALVPEDRRAWHAGVACWRGDTDINSRSIGVELQNPGHDFGYPEFPEAQMTAAIALCKDILARHPIPPAGVLAHADVAPLRKKDPGEKLNWKRLADEGIGLWKDPPPNTPPGTPLGTPLGTPPILRPGDRGDAVAQLRQNLAAFGYDIPPGDLFDARAESVVCAFQRHFRPSRADGIADSATAALAAALAAEAGTKTGT